MWRSFAAAAALIACWTASATAADYRIMVATWRGCEDACRGFQDYLTDQGIDAEFIMRNAAQNSEAVAGLLTEARAEDVDLILTWGTSVTRGVVGTLDQAGDASVDLDIPSVFMIVADPVGARIVESLDDTGRPNVTGTYNRVPEEVNIQTIRTYQPDFDRLGLLYNTNEANSVLKRDEIASLTGSMGFELVALELPLDSEGMPRVEDITPKMAELKSLGVDFLYLGSSSFLQDNSDVVTAVAIEYGIPVLSPYERLVRQSQALISVAARYYDVGRLAGAQAERILVDGLVPGDLPVARLTEFAVVINMGVAGKLGLFPPLGLLQIAEAVD